MPRFLLIAIYVCLNFVCFSQTPDTTKAIRLNDSNVAKPSKKQLYGRPRTATILSAVLPGAGQVYNKKYWKVPLIYAGIGGFGYWFYLKNDSYKYYRAAEIKSVDSSGYALADGKLLSTGDLSSLKFEQKKYRDYAFIGIAAVYLLNIVDANVDAHLRTFDVSDDLSMTIDPWQRIITSFGERRIVNGISVKINFR